MSETARANRDGHPCPPWCTADHDQELLPGSFSTAHSSEGAHAAGATVTAVLFPSVREPEVQVCTPGVDGGSIFLPAREAGYLAVLIRELAGAAPEEHRELAAAIRRAAAQITEAGDG
jgi:hypothetical protein